MRLAVLALASVSLWAQNANQVRDRGQTEPRDQSWTRGRLAAHVPIPEKPSTYNGMLIDATCDDRSALNIARQPEQRETSPQPDPKANQPADTMARQEDRTCAISGGTRGFALLTTNGRLLNLDEGGNTLANQAIYTTDAGRAMINGTGGAIKPHTTIQGRALGDRLIVEKILIR